MREMEPFVVIGWRRRMLLMRGVHLRWRRGAGSLLGVVLLAVSLSPVTGAAPTPAPDTATFRDPDGRFALQVPADWQMRQSTVAETVASWRSAPPVGVFSISTEAAPALSLDRYQQVSIESIKRQNPGVVVDTTKVQSLTLGGLPARRLEYTYTSQGAQVQVANVFALQNDVAYVLTFGATPDNLAPFLDRSRIVLDSFAFLKPTVASSRAGGGIAQVAGYLVGMLLTLAAIPALIIYLVRRRKRTRAGIG